MDQRIHAIGKMYVCFQLAGNEYEDDVYTFTQLSGVIISWRAAKALSSYHPITSFHHQCLPLHSQESGPQ